MTRNDFGNYATKLINFVCGGRHKRGEGKCKTWETKIDASGLSEKMRGILNLNPGDLVSLSQYREWANMKFERGFKEGPGKADKKWQVGSTISWSSYLRLIVEVICFIDASSRSGSPQLVPPQVRGEIEDKEAPNLYISSPSAQLPAPPSTSSTSAPLPPPQSKSSTYHVQVARDPWASQPQQATASPTPLDLFSPSSPVKTSEGANLPPHRSTSSTSPPLPQPRSTSSTFVPLPPPSPSQSAPRIENGPGPLSECLTEWVLNYYHTTLCQLPLDVDHPPRLQVCIAKMIFLVFWFSSKQHWYVFSINFSECYIEVLL